MRQTVDRRATWREPHRTFPHSGGAACRVGVRASRMWRSQVINHEKNPEWDEDFKLLVHEPEHQARARPHDMCPSSHRWHLTGCRASQGGLWLIVMAENDSY